MLMSRKEKNNLNETAEADVVKPEIEKTKLTTLGKINKRAKKV